MKNTLKNNIILILGLSFVLATSSALATTWTIQDKYIGGVYKSTYAQKDGDVIAYADPNDPDKAAAEIDKYDIDAMTIDIDKNGRVTVYIITDFLYQTGVADGKDIDYGDLFISTTGWDPAGINDSYDTTGTSWGYAISSDTGKIYTTTEDTFMLSDNKYAKDSNHDGIDDNAAYYRKNQIIKLKEDDTSSSQFIDTIASVNKFGTDLSGANNAIVYSQFNLTDLGLSLDQSNEIAFRWAMTCANDVIEGSVTWEPVPEPATMVLLGFGLLGLGAVGRKRARMRTPLE